MEALGVKARGFGSAYAARDVINAPAIRRAIERRSQARNDPPEVRTWLLNHFYRHAVGNLIAPAPALLAVSSLDHARSLFHPGTVPDWVGARYKQGLPTELLWWLDPDGPDLLAMEARLVEFLESRQGTSLEGKLMRVNCPQALARWALEHAAFEAKAAAGWREHEPDAVQPLWHGCQGTFVEMLPRSLLLRSEMAYESQIMRHCLGQFANRRALTGGYGERYASACEAGTIRLFSYRTGRAHPHITLSAAVGADGRLTIEQIKGKQNCPPVAQYRDEVMRFLNSLETDEQTPPDAAAMGLVRSRRGWCSPSSIDDEAEQLALVNQYPALVRDLGKLSKLVQWVVAGRQPQSLAGLDLAPNVAFAVAQDK